MKKLLLYSLMATIVAMPCFAADEPIVLARITPERMEQLQQKVAQDIAKDTWKKRTFYTAALLAGGYLGYRYFTAAPVAQEAAPASADQLLVNNKLLQINNGLMRNALPDMNETKTGTLAWLQESTLGKVGTWVWEIGKWSAQQTMITYFANVLLMGSSSALGNIIKSVDNTVDAVSLSLFHDRDVKWFLITRARVTTLFNELESHARCLETGKIIAHTDVQQQELTRPVAPQADPGVLDAGLSLTPQMYAYHMNAFAQTWNQLNERIASLAAFIQHKAATLAEGAVQDRLNAGAQQIIMIANAAASRLESMLADATYNTLPTDVQYEVHRLRASVSDELLNVNKLEHEISW